MLRTTAIAALGSLLTACGSAAPPVEAPAAEPAPLDLSTWQDGDAEPAPAPQTRLTLAPLRVGFADGVELAMSDDGRWSINGQPVGRIRTDGTFADQDEVELGRLHPEGHVTLGEHRLPLRIRGSRMEVDNGHAATIDDSGVLTLAGSGIAPVPVEGIAPETHRTTLYMLALFIGLARAAEIDAPTATASRN